MNSEVFAPQTGAYLAQEPSLRLNSAPGRLVGDRSPSQLRSDKRLRVQSFFTKLNECNFSFGISTENKDSSKLLHDCILMVSRLKMIGCLSFHNQTLAEMVFCCMPDDQIRFSRGQFQAASEPDGLAACEAFLHEQSEARKIALRHASLLFNVASIAVWSRSLSCFVRLLASLELLQFDLCFQRSFIGFLSSTLRKGAGTRRGQNRRVDRRVFETPCSTFLAKPEVLQPVSLLFTFSLPRNSSWLLS